MSGQINQLVKMVNQIALNFGESRDPELAASKTAEHIGKFWTRAMREQLWRHWRDGEANLSPTVELMLESGVCNPE